jgi:hypothetical protein
MTLREPTSPLAHWAQWQAASGARGKKRNWRVCRYLDGPGVTAQALKDKAGRRRSFASFDAAHHAAMQARVDTATAR